MNLHYLLRTDITYNNQEEARKDCDLSYQIPLNGVKPLSLWPFTYSSFATQTEMICLLAFRLQICILRPRHSWWQLDMLFWILEILGSSTIYSFARLFLQQPAIENLKFHVRELPVSWSWAIMKRCWHQLFRGKYNIQLMQGMRI